jgi:hypothetical protein
VVVSSWMRSPAGIALSRLVVDKGPCSLAPGVVLFSKVRLHVLGRPVGTCQCPSERTPDEVDTRHTGLSWVRLKYQDVVCMGVQRLGDAVGER